MLVGKGKHLHQFHYQFFSLKYLKNFLEDRFFLKTFYKKNYSSLVTFSSTMILPFSDIFASSITITSLLLLLLVSSSGNG